MRIIKTGDLVVNIFDSIEELPASNHNEFNIAILEDENIGNGIEAIEKHNRQILDFLLLNNAEYALEQAKSQNFCIQNTKLGYNSKRVALCNLIHSINGKEPISRNTDFLIEQIAEISDTDIENTVNDLKKNLIPN